MTQVILTFWLVLAYDLLEDRRKINVTISFYGNKFNSFLYKTNRFHVALCLFSNRSQMTSKCGNTWLSAHVPHFDIICDLLLNRRTATWNLFVKWWCQPQDNRYVRATMLGFSFLSYWLQTWVRILHQTFNHITFGMFRSMCVILILFSCLKKGWFRFYTKVYQDRGWQSHPKRSLQSPGGNSRFI